MRGESKRVRSANGAHPFRVHPRCSCFKISYVLLSSRDRRIVYSLVVKPAEAVAAESRDIMSIHPPTPNLQPFGAARQGTPS